MSYARLDALEDGQNVEMNGLTPKPTEDEFDHSHSHSSWRWSAQPEDVKHNARFAYDFVMYPNGNPLLAEVKRNLKSGITVSLVNVPLSISLAIAGGAAPAMGIVTAFWAGIIAALCGGSHFNIVGPTGALSGVLAAAANYDQNGPSVLPVLAIMAGVLCFLVWLFKLDRYVMFIPSSVIHGFTVGVAFIIALNQLNYILGLHGLKHHESFLGNVGESLANIGSANPWSIVYFIINLTALFFLLRKWPTIPWAIVIAVIGILVGFLVTKKVLPITLETLDDRFPGLSLELVVIPDFKGQYFSQYILSQSFGVAFIAILETLISARIADGMTKTEHQQRREVLGISLANLAVGIVGGIPATAALARTSLNVKSGASSRVSAVLNCIAVLLLSLVFLPFFKYIPMSTIAAMLVMTAIRMVEVHHLKHMYQFDRKMFAMLVLTALVCVVFDTMVGILVGGLISLLLFTDEMSVGHTEIHVTKDGEMVSVMDVKSLDKKQLPKLNVAIPMNPGSQLAATLPESSEGIPQMEEFGSTIVYRLTGQLTYVNSVAHVARVKKLAHDPTIRNVIISFRYLFFIDLDGVDALKEMIGKLEHKNKSVLLAGCNLHEAVLARLEHHPFFISKVTSGQVFSSYLDALNYVSGKNATSSQSSPIEEEKHSSPKL